MKKVLLYPFSEEMSCFLKKNNTLFDIEITSIVSFKGSSILGDIYNYRNEKLEVTSNFDLELEKCEYILLNNYIDHDNNNLDMIVLENIKKAINLDKKIIFFDNLNSITKKLLEIIPLNNQLKITQPVLENVLNDSNLRIYNIDVPVIFVCSTFENLNKFDIQLSIRRKLLNDGYKILQIGTKQICEFFGFYSFPSFMYSKEIEECTKVVMFNNFLKKLEVSEKPDIIIIGVPGGILPFSQKAIGDLGITMYKITQAVRPDSVILSIPYKNYTLDELNHLNKIVQSKFNVDIDYYNVSPKSLLHHPTEIKNHPKYLTLDKSFIRKKLLNIDNDNLFVLSYEDEISRLTTDIITQFTKYGTILSV